MPPRQAVSRLTRRTLVLMLGGLVTLPCAGYAGTLFSAMAYGGFGFDSADAGAAVEWTLPWYGELDAEAADATPDAQVLGLEPEGNDLSLSVKAMTPLGLAYADYSVTDGDRVAAPAGANPVPGAVTGYADVQIELGASDSWAYSYAGSYFENSFRLAGGTVGDSVQVSFQLGWSREFGVDVGASVGRWELLNGIFLSLYDLATTQLLAESTVRVAQSGYSMAAFGDADSKDLLGISATLLYGHDYILNGAADVLVSARTPAPAPAPGALLLAGWIGLRLAWSRNRRGTAADARRKP